MRDADAVFAEKWDSAIAESVDEVERVCFELAWKGDPQLIQFILKSHRPAVYRDVQRHEIDARACGVILMPQKEDLPP
jgi:hypothetical protein